MSSCFFNRPPADPRSVPRAHDLQQAGWFYWTAFDLTMVFCFMYLTACSGGHFCGVIAAACSSCIAQRRGQSLQRGFNIAPRQSADSCTSIYRGCIHSLRYIDCRSTAAIAGWLLQLLHLLSASTARFITDGVRFMQCDVPLSAPSTALSEGARTRPKEPIHTRRCRVVTNQLASQGKQGASSYNRTT